MSTPVAHNMTQTMAKTIVQIKSAPPQHWVGNGFKVHGMFNYNDNAALFSPFLLMDYGAPTQFAPNNGAPNGVGSHPHRGFETVTIAYAGEVTHRDSAGGGGTIAAGDVQWMTAGAGIVHNEFHSPAFSQQGGTMHMVQLWVNLPAKNKMTPAHYQAISQAQIAQVDSEAGTVRLIAGDLDGHKGAAETYTPIRLWDLHVKAGQTLSLTQPDGWTTLLLVQSGTVRINDSSPVGAAQLVVLSRQGSAVHIQASADAHLLLLAGEPINETVVGYGPFVMNTKAEIQQAFVDFDSGKFGEI
ncbi:MAG TPA: pirin family protein [Burkholderiaceae bacterium]|nr:pirin family protein [Burkholderiaceae bacterium]